MTADLMRLLRANARRDSGILSARGDEPELMLYDVIVASDADADWWGGVSAESVVRTLSGLTAPRVHLRVNSPGGDAFAGIAIANAMRAYPGEVVMHVDGFAASAAGFLATATDRVVMGPGTMIMVHKAWSICLGNADDMMASAAVLEKLDGQQIELFRAKVAGTAPDYDWDAALRAETWFTAEEAIAIGLASETMALPEDKAKSAAAMAFDLSAYRHAPAAQLPPAAAATGDEKTGNDEAKARRQRVARALAAKGLDGALR